MKFCWSTRISADEFLDKLRDRTERPPFFAFRMPSEETVYGRISHRRFKLFVLKPDSLFNTMMPFFFGRVEDRPGGAVVRGRLGVHPLPVFILVCYLGIALSMAVFMTWAAIAGHGEFSVPPVFAVPIPLIFGAIGIVVFRFGVAAGEEQRQAIVRFLESVVNPAP